ncbi:hypothetical protein CH300_00235 [Rhodococcus sp. 15-1154-1]|nr:hypothetical protein [Rhodococcus sp. 15-1154-1]OZF09844.1 hypothetical protein CH300_00235 [Rhodococcus sp. 15-1154-1]
MRTTATLPLRHHTPRRAKCAAPSFHAAVFDGDGGLPIVDEIGRRSDAGIDAQQSLHANTV